MRLANLSAFTEAGLLNSIVEAPRGSRVKFEYDSAADVFRINRPLPVGLAYPFDWGFVVGTKADDGDPVDVVILGDHVSYPGTLIEGRIIAALDVQETRRSRAKLVRNPRIVMIPKWIDVSLGLAQLDDVRNDIAQFLIRVGESAGKKIVEHCWQRAEDAQRYVEAHCLRSS